MRNINEKKTTRRRTLTQDLDILSDATSIKNKDSTMKPSH